VSGLRGVTLTVRFLCELGMLAALAYWGFTVGDGVGVWVLGVGAPLLAAAVWGALVAPKARWPVPIPTRVVIELVLFGATAGALAVAGQPLAAVVLGVAALATSLLNASQERQAARQTTRFVGWCSASTAPPFVLFVQLRSGSDSSQHQISSLELPIRWVDAAVRFAGDLMVSPAAHALIP
jgi:Protein of unknown function (DUF2568)